MSHVPEQTDRQADKQLLSRKLTGRSEKVQLGRVILFYPNCFFCGRLNSVSLSCRHDDRRQRAALLTVGRFTGGGKPTVPPASQARSGTTPHAGPLRELLDPRGATAPCCLQAAALAAPCRPHTRPGNDSTRRLISSCCGCSGGIHSSSLNLINTV